MAKKKITKKTGAIISIVLGGILLVAPQVISLIIGAYLIVAGIITLAYKE